RPITARQWRDYEIVGDIENDAEVINIGVLLLSSGKVWIDGASFQVVGKPKLEAPRPLTERGLDNVVAFTRLLGYVRYFHPGDEATKTDWEEFAVRGMRAVEAAPDAGALAGTLTTLFQPVAPTLRVYPASLAAAPPLPALPAGAKP